MRSAPQPSGESPSPAAGGGAGPGRTAQKLKPETCARRQTHVIHAALLRTRSGQLRLCYCARSGQLGCDAGEESAEPAVEQAHLELTRPRQQQARRAQVPVRHPRLALVHVVERLRELQRPPHRLPPGRRPHPRAPISATHDGSAARGEGGGEGAAGGKLADEKDAAGGVVEAGAEEAGYPRVSEAGEGVDFEEEETLDDIVIDIAS